MLRLKELLMKIKREAEYGAYAEALAEDDKALLKEYFSRLSQHMILPKKQERAILEDFEKALLYYAREGLDLKTALDRLDPVNLGGFYARPPILWCPLDDAAKIYPLSMKRRQMAVFRLSVYLREEVVPELLQIALSFTIKRFPSFAMTVKNGLFWHYMEAAKRRYAVQPETEIPCSPLKVSSSGSTAFRVIYYKNRVSAEFFHILTDGTGGLIFLKTLTAEYLRLRGCDIDCEDGVLDINEAPSAGETANGFVKAETGAKASGRRSEKTAGFMDERATPMSGRLAYHRPCQVIHFELDSHALTAAAKERNATVTEFMLALMFYAGKFATEELRGKIHIQVPVNMRKFYPSDTIRNFTLYCNIKIPISESAAWTRCFPK
jgi:hypothetical protein